MDTSRRAVDAGSRRGVNSTRSGAVRFVRRYRRSLAFVLAFLGVLVGLGAIKERPPSWDALVFSRDLPAGSVLTPADVQVVALTLAARPPTAVLDHDSVAQAVLAAPVSAGEVVLTTRLVGPGLLSGAPPDFVAMPIDLDDPTGYGFLRAGDVVDVLAAPRSAGIDGSAAAPAVTVARGARVLALPAQGGRHTSSLLAGDQNANSGSRAVIVGVPSDVAGAVAGAATASHLSLVVRGQG